MLERLTKLLSLAQHGQVACLLICPSLILVACWGGSYESSGPSPAAQTPSASPIQASSNVIAFVTRTNERSQLRLAQANGSGLTALTAPMDVIMDPVWSPDGQQVAFEACRGSAGECSSGMDIFVVNADGTGLTNITNNAAQDREPCWSPDGSRLAFTSDRSGIPKVVIARRDGSAVTQLTHGSASEGSPQWSPNGHQIAFERIAYSPAGGTTEIWSINAAGTGESRLAQGVRPRWSPDGALIAFGCSTGPHTGICVVHANGSFLTNLSDGLADEFNMSWSPDGTEIVYVTNRDSNAEVYLRKIANPASPTSINLTSSPANDQDPVWSPDGSRIAYSSDGSLSVMNADGSNKVKLPLTILGPPAWRP